MKYFVVSDIHSFADELIKALAEKGYDKDNPNNTLIVCGDVFDRGSQTLQVYKFLKSIPKDNLILIKGNHEALYFELLEKHFPDSHDFSNGTVKTFCQIAKVDPCYLDEDTYHYDYDIYFKMSRINWKDIVEKVKKSAVTKWLKSKQWKNYYELDNYIFVHSFIPKKLKEQFENEVIGYRKDNGEPAYAKDYTYLVKDMSWFKPVQDWRNCSDKEWEDTSWGNPWLQYQTGLFDLEKAKGKILVCGHWHTSDFYKHLDFNKKYSQGLAPLYISDNLIGLDGGVDYNYTTESYNHPQNVLVIDDNLKII